MRTALLLVVSACVAAAQVAKAPTKAAGPIVVGGSSTARSVTAAPAPPIAKPGAGAATATGGKPAAVAATPAPAVTPVGKPAAVAVMPAGKPAPATVAVTPAGKPAAIGAIVPANVPGARPSAPAGGTAAARSPPAAAPASTPASTPAAMSASGAQAGGASITIERESYGYDRGSRRDPFTSLLQADELRPTMADLRLVGVIVDPRGRNSLAVLRDLSTKEMYRLRSGATIGRLRLTQISQRSVTFVIEEFGVSRQETLSLRDSTSVRRP